MRQIKIGTKNQIVIPKEVRQKISGLKPGRNVFVYTLDPNTVAIKVADKSWSESSYGALKNSSIKESAAAEIDKMRNEWDEK